MPHAFWLTHRCSLQGLSNKPELLSGFLALPGGWPLNLLALLAKQDRLPAGAYWLLNGGELQDRAPVVCPRLE